MSFSWIRARALKTGCLLFLSLASVIPCHPAGDSAPALPWTPSRGQGAFLMLSDIHFDPFADPALPKKLAAAPSEEWEGIFSASKGEEPCGYGEDTHHALFRSTLRAAASAGPYDYVLVAGDYLSHDFKHDFEKTVEPIRDGLDSKYQNFIVKTVQYVTGEIQKSFPGIPVFFALGNNDSAHGANNAVRPYDALLTALSGSWRVTSGDAGAAKSFSENGWYVVPHPTLKDHEIAVLDDIYWYYKYTGYGDLDGADRGPWELKWLEGVLRDARTEGKKVTLLTHMPPGIHSRNASQHPDRDKLQKTFYVQQYLWPYLNLLASYRDVVDGEYCGHTHLDDFRVPVDRSGKPVFFAHVIPSVSPVDYSSPAFQVALYDRKDGTVRDMATYTVSDLKKPEWGLEYSFRDAYGYDAYNKENLLALAGAIKEQGDIRAKYVRYCVGGSPGGPCRLGNWRFYACAHTVLDPAEYRRCYP